MALDITAAKIKTMELQELVALEEELGRALDLVRTEKETKARAKIEEIAAAAGMTPQQLVGASGSTASRRAPAKPKFRHPEDASLTWSGRGRKPKWVEELLASGKKLDDLAIE